MARELTALIERHGKPGMIVSDHGTEYTCNAMLAWCRDKFFLAIKDIPRVRDYVLQMKFKPMPSFHSQAVMQDDARNRNDLVGRMFLQSLVHIPEVLTGLGGAALIGVSLWSSMRWNRGNPEGMRDAE